MGSEDKDKASNKYNEVRKTVWLIYFLGFLDMCGASMNVAVLPNLAYNLKASKTLTGLFISEYGALQLLSGPFIGKLSDMYGRKPVLVVSQFICAVSYVCMGSATSMLLLALYRVPSGLFKHGMSTSRAYLIDVVPASDKSSVLGMFTAISNLGFMVGPLLGGFLADTDPSLQLTFTVSGFIFLLISAITFVCLPHLSSPQNDIKELQKLTFKSLCSFLNVFSGINWQNVKEILSLQFILTLSTMIFRRNYPQFLQERFHLNYKSLGIILSLNGAIGALSSGLSGHVTKLYGGRSSLIVLHGTLLLAFSFLVATISPHYIITVACLLPVSLSTSNLKVSMLSLLTDRAGDAERGSLIGVGTSINSFSRMIAPGMVGVAQELSTTAAGLLSAAFGATGVMVAALIHYKY